MLNNPSVIFFHWCQSKPSGISGHRLFMSQMSSMSLNSVRALEATQSIKASTPTSAMTSSTTGLFDRRGAGPFNNSTHQKCKCKQTNYIFQTRSAGTVHTSAKACLTSVTIWIRIRIVIRIRDPDRRQNLIICSLALCQPSLEI